MLTGQSTLIVIPEQIEDDVFLAYGFDISTLVAWNAIALQSAQ